MANVYLSVSGKDIRSIDELRKLINNIDWIQVYQPDAGFQGGISINQVALFNDTDKRKDMGEDEILKTYQNNLQLFADNTRIWGQFDLSDGLSKVYQPNQIKETLKETKELK